MDSSFYPYFLYPVRRRNTTCFSQDRPASAGTFEKGIPLHSEEPYTWHKFRLDATIEIVKFSQGILHQFSSFENERIINE